MNSTAETTIISLLKAILEALQDIKEHTGWLESIADRQ